MDGRPRLRRAGPVLLLSAMLLAGSAARADLVFDDSFETAAACDWSTFVSSTIPGGCVIAAVCYDPAEANPAVPCERCDPSISQVAWSPTPDGLACEDGDLCTGTETCSGGTCVAGSSNNCDDAVACTIDTCNSLTECDHEPNHASCDDGHACTADSCSPVFGCESPVVAGSCLIDGTCRADGDSNPGNACEFCSDATPTGWSARDDDYEVSAQTCSGDSVQTAVTCSGGDPVGGDLLGCGAYTCVDGTCLGFCTQDEHCAAGYGCDGIACKLQNDGTCAAHSQCLSGLCEASVCTAKRVNGSSCSSANQCSSNFCVDGLCCNTSCNGTCLACTMAKKGGGSDGTCGNVGPGTDPDNECFAQSPDTCGTNGFCSGAGSCALWSAGIVCQAATCVDDDTVSSTRTCNGTGTCPAATTVECAPYKCEGTACRTTCDLDTHCVAPALCMGGACTPP